MAGTVQYGRSVGPQLRLSKAALVVALLAALGAGPRTFAQHDGKEHAENGREEREEEGSSQGRGWPMIGAKRWWLIAWLLSSFSSAQ